MGQMASLLTERQHGSLPSNSEVNPRGEKKEYCKAITLRSGRELEVPGPQPPIRELKISEQDQIAPKDHMQGEQPRDMRAINDNNVRKEIEKQIRSNEPAILIPYPQRLKKSKLER